MSRVIHFEIHGTDTAKLAEFYRKIFGWEITQWGGPDVDYWMIATAPEGSNQPGINGGIVGRRGPGPKGGEPVTSFVCTIDVPNLDECIKKTEKTGGKNIVPRMPIPGLAWLAYCTDPEGNIFGIYEADPKAK